MDRQRLETRPVRLVGDSQPHRKGGLRGQAVIMQGRQETDDPVGDALTGFHQGMVMGNIGLGQHIQAPAHPLHQPALMQSSQIVSGNTIAIQVTGTENTPAFQNLEKLLQQGLFSHNRIIISVYINKVPRYYNNLTYFS